MKCKISYLLFFLGVFVSFMTHAQERTISGKVVDNTGPLPGVNVIIKGTAIGVNQRATLKCSENSEMLCQSVKSVSQNILERNDLCWYRSCRKFCSVGHPLL